MARSRWILPAVLAVLPSLAYAQDSATPKTELPADVKAVLEKVDKTIYNAQAAGLKDLSFSMSMPMLAQMGITDPIKIYWKSPDLSKVELPEQLATMMGGNTEQASKQMGRTARLLANETYVERLAGYTVKLEKDGELSKITATTTDKTKDATEMVFWIDSNNLVVKMKQKAAQANPMLGDTIEQGITYRKEGDKYLPLEMKGEQSGSTKLEYAQVNGFWFPSKMTIEGPASPMGPMTIEFKDVKVNAGLQDSFFKPAEKTDKPKEPEKKVG